MNFTGTVSLTISLTEIPHCFINGNCPSLSICPADQQFRQTRTIVPYTTYCLSVRPDEGTVQPKGFVVVSSDLTKYTASSYKHECSSSKPTVSVKVTVRLVRLFGCGQSTLLWGGSRMGPAAPFVDWTLPVLFLINTILKRGLNCYWEFTTPIPG